MNEHILIVEDDPGISRFLTLELNHDGYQTTAVFDGQLALEAAIKTDYDLIILDLMLPTLNGIEVLKALREQKNTPVIILTARDQLMDKVAGLDLGASDYMIKPFAVEELLARIRANLRKPMAASPSLAIGELKVDLDKRTVFIGKDEVNLTKKEFDLLVFLLQNREQVLSREEIVSEVWGYDFVGNTNLVDVYVRYLRAKIDDTFGISLIKTVRGSGYILELSIKED